MTLFRQVGIEPGARIENVTKRRFKIELNTVLRLFEGVFPLGKFAVEHASPTTVDRFFGSENSVR
jgi:hypothetical protein